LVYLGALSIRSESLLLKKESQERIGKTAEAIRDQAQAVVVELLHSAPSSKAIVLDPGGRSHFTSQRQS